MIDSHCHLAGDEFAGDLEAVAARAREAGLVRLLVILAAEADAEFARVAAVRAAWPGVRFGIGVHPHHAHQFADDHERAAGLVRARLDATPGAVAIGEIGLDYHYDFSPRDVQQAVFRAQLRLSRALDLPVILHTREADDDTLRILAEEGGVLLRGVFHCFTGDRAFAERAVATGFYVSFSGIATFPAAGSIREAVRVVPDERVLIETDAPYLAPPPHRGKRNEPAWVVKVAEVVARERGLDPAGLVAAVTANFDRLFDREHRPQSPALQ